VDPRSSKGPSVTVVALMSLLTLMLGGCPQGGPTGERPIMGRVDFPAVRQVQATPQEIGTAATVSLIDPATSRTIATTLTQPDRTFSLSIAGFMPQVKTYVLEAVKGLNSNVAGYDAARLRTLVRWNGSSWAALTTGDASIGVSTTALSAIVGLRSTYTPVDPDLLIGKLTLGSPDTFVATGTGVAPSEYSGVYTLVDQVLGNNRDPLEALLYDGSAYSLKSLTSPLTQPFISRLDPNPVSAGSQLTVVGGNFRPVPGENTVTLNGLGVTVLSGASQSLLVVLPSGVSSGTLRLSTPDGVATASMTITPSIDGGLLPATNSPLVPTAPGTDIPGSVFGR